MDKKKILNKLKKIDESNRLLFAEKANLEEAILKADIKIWEITKEYDKLCRELLK